MLTQILKEIHANCLQYKKTHEMGVYNFNHFMYNMFVNLYVLPQQHILCKPGLLIGKIFFFFFFFLIFVLPR